MKRTAFRWVAVSSVVFAMVVPTLARTRPRYGRTLRMQSQASAEVVARGLVLEPLTRVDEAGNAQPLLATKWLSQNDGTRWQFWLRSGITFHDATPLTPAVVAEALSAAKCDGACPWRVVRVLGDSVLFEADQPIRDLPSILALDEFAIVRNAQGTLVGTGPFRIQSATYDAITLGAFEDAWAGRPFIDAIEIRGGRSVRDQLMDLGVGRADLVEVPAEQLRRAQQERVRVFASPAMEMIAVRAQPRSTALQDQRTRAALAMTLDRNSLFNVIFQKQGETSASLLPNWMTGYGFLFQTTTNLPKARELKAQSPKVGPITLAVDPGDSTLQLIAERVALNARDAGFQVQVVPDNANHSADIKVERIPLSSTNVAVALRGLGARIDPSAESEESLYRAEREFLQQYTVIPLVHLPRAVGANTRVRNLELSPTGTPQLADVWLEGGK
jgi:peptide/nickel transport system substrate-binding protein